MRLTSIFFLVALLLPTLAFSEDSNPEANEMFTEAVLLYRQAETQEGVEARRTLAEVKKLIEAILQDHPDTLPAERLAEGGVVAGIDLDRLGVGDPAGLTDPMRQIVRELLDVYNWDIARIERVAAAAEYAFLACAAYHEDGRNCGDEHAWQSGVGTESLGWTPERIFRDDNLVGGQLIAFLYAHVDGRRALVFRGTDSDWEMITTNFAGSGDPAFLSTGQLQFASNLAERWAEDYPELIFAGHSLGGRLAQIATLETGRPSYVFNSAPKGAWEKIRYEHVWSRGDALVKKFRSPDDPVSLLDLREGEGHDEVSNIARTGDGFGTNTLGAAQGYVHSISVVADAMNTVASYYADGWIDALLSEREAENLEKSAAFLDDIGLTPGLYAIDPALCSVEATVSDAWGSLFQMISEVSVRRGEQRICTVKYTRIIGRERTSGAVATVGADCNANGLVEDDGWHWRKLSSVAFEETKGQYIGKTFTLCPSVNADAEEETASAEPAAGAGEGGDGQCSPMAEGLNTGGIFDNLVSRNLDGETVDGDRWSLWLNDDLPANVGRASFTNANGDVSNGTWYVGRATSGNNTLCQSYNGGTSYACHEILPCRAGVGAAFAMRNEDGRISSFIEVRRDAGTTAAPASAANEVFEPERGSDIRTALLNALRPVAENAFGAPVEFLVDDLKVSGGFAFASVRTQRPGGGAIALEETPMFLRGQLDLDLGTPNQIQALLTRYDTVWATEQVVFQPTEAWWLGSCLRFGSLFPGQCASEAVASPSPDAGGGGDGVFVQTHSRRDFDEAYEIARALAAAGAPNVNVFQASNGWFAVTAARVAQGSATRGRLLALIAEHSLPSDSIYTSGENFVDLRASFEGHSTRPDLGAQTNAAIASDSGQPVARQVVRNMGNTVSARMNHLTQSGFVSGAPSFRMPRLEPLRSGKSAEALPDLDRSSVKNLLDTIVLGGWYVDPSLFPISRDLRVAEANLSAAAGELENLMRASDLVSEQRALTRLNQLLEVPFDWLPSYERIEPNELARARFVEDLGYRAVSFWQTGRAGSDVGWVPIMTFGLLSAGPSSPGLAELDREGILVGLIKASEIVGVFETDSVAEVEFTLASVDLPPDAYDGSGTSPTQRLERASVLQRAEALGVPIRSVVTYPMQGTLARENIDMSNPDLIRTAVFRKYDDGWRFWAIR